MIHTRHRPTALGSQLISRMKISVGTITTRRGVAPAQYSCALAPRRPGYFCLTFFLFFLLLLLLLLLFICSCEALRRYLLNEKPYASNNTRRSS